MRFYQINENLWFESEKMLIASNADEKCIIETHYHKIDNCSITKQSEYPTIIYISATSCNLKCKYCYADDGTYSNNSKIRHFNFENYKKVFHSVIEKYGGVKAISFFGGEPLLNFIEIKKFVEWISETNYIQPQLAIASNGTIMSDEIKEFIRRYNIGFSTSLDGPKYFNDENRVGNNVKSVFDSVCKTLSYLSDIDVEKAIQFTISKIHLENYSKGDFLKWGIALEKLRIKHIEVVPVTSYDPKYMIDVNNPAVLHIFTQLCEDIADYNLNKLIIDAPLYNFSYIFFGILLSIFKRRKQRSCSVGFSISVSPDLKVYPCHLCAADDIFSIDLETLREPNSPKTFASVRDIERDHIDECKNCIAFNLCPYLCKAEYVKSGNRLVDARCEMMRIFLKKSILFIDENYDKYKLTIKKHIEELRS